MITFTCNECGAEHEYEPPIPPSPEEEERMRQWHLEQARKFREEEAKQPLYCSFCGTSGTEQPLVQGPSVYICRSCADLCVAVHKEGKGLVRTWGERHG